GRGQGVHHRHQRRHGHHGRDGERRLALRHGEPDADVPHHAGHRRSRPARCRDPAAARAPARHHGQALSGRPVIRRWMSPGIVVTGAVMIVVGVGAPLLVDQFQLLQLTVFASMCILALSLGVVWGYGGILCFGQSAFFGLGAYTYAVTAVNMSESTLAIVLSVVMPAVFAALLGYFMFY